MPTRSGEAYDHFMRAMYYYRRRGQGGVMLTRALEELDAAAAPRNAVHYLNRAMCRLAMIDTAGACADAETALRLGEYPLAKGIVALVNLNGGDTLAARAALQQLLATAGDPELEQGMAVATLLIALRDPQGAIDYLERVRPRPGYGLPLFQRLVEASRP